MEKLSLPEIEPLVMRSPGDPRYPPKVSQGEVATVLTGLKPGRYHTADLYRRYEALAEQLGKEPASRASLGMALGRFLLGPWGTRGKDPRNHPSTWTVTPELAAKLSATPTS